MNVLKEQYDMVIGSRRAMLHFISNNLSDQIAAPLGVFNNSTIKDLLVHIINTYIHWIANFGMRQELPFVNENSINSVEDIELEFKRVDELLFKSFNYFDDLHLPVSGNVSSGVPITVTVLRLFTHVITHEFHHKGQIMTMCRLLGHVPIDTDVIRF